MTNLILARRYAKALLLLGKEENQYKEYGEILKDFASTLRANEPLADALMNPIYPLKERRAVLEKVISITEMPKMVTSFLLLLMNKRRLSMLEAIIEIYDQLIDEMENIARARVKAATELSDDDAESVKKVLEQITGQSVRMEMEVDPDLIGGVVAQVGDLVLDGSIRRQLLNIKESLKRGERV